MKNIRLLTFVLMIGSLVLSACGAAAATATPTAVSARQNVEAMPVSFVGIVDSIAGDQWVISGTTVTVHKSIVRDGPFQVGDRIKVEGLVSPDGSFTVLRVEAPTPQETATQPPVVADNSNEAIGNGNTNDANVNDDNSNDDNSNDSNSNDSNTNDDDGGNANDDNSNDGNTNDDNGGNSNDDNSNDDNGGNSNDDHGDDDNENDDNSGGGGGDDNSNDD